MDPYGYESGKESLDNDTLIHIFSKLPFKEVFKLRCLSKQWLTILSHPFMTKILTHNQDPTALLHIFWDFGAVPPPEGVDMSLCDLGNALANKGLRPRSISMTAYGDFEKLTSGQTRSLEMFDVYPSYFHDLDCDFSLTRLIQEMVYLVLKKPQPANFLFLSRKPNWVCGVLEQLEGMGHRIIHCDCQSEIFGEVGTDTWIWYRPMYCEPS